MRSKKIVTVTTPVNSKQQLNYPKSITANTISLSSHCVDEFLFLVLSLSFELYFSATEVLFCEIKVFLIFELPHSRSAVWSYVI